MQLGMVGLGRMGANIVRRLMRDGHECVVYDVSEDSIATLEKEGATGARTVEDFVAALTPPRVAWVMIPAGITGRAVDEIASHMERGDIIIDGGNSNYREDIDRAAALKPAGIHHVDVGTSGGVWGLERADVDDVISEGEFHVLRRILRKLNAVRGFRRRAWASLGVTSFDRGKRDWALAETMANFLAGIRGHPPPRASFLALDSVVHQLALGLAA